MTRHWPIIRLGDLVDPKRGITYGIVQPGQHVSDGVPIIRVSDLKGDRVDIRNPMIVARDIEAAYSRTRLKGGELIMSIVGTVGQTAIVDQSLAGWNVARAVAVIPVLPEIGAYWIRLSLRGGLAKDHIDARLNTTVQATLNLKDLSNLPITVPPEGERNAIAATLGALDDKIELNRKMNSTLEAMARALFRDWFVDFGPTRAKMAGRAPYLSPDLWSLFPDRLDDEGKPEGWEAVSFGSLLESSIGGDWGSGEADIKQTVKAAIVRGTDIPDLLNGGPNRVPQRFVEAKKFEKRRLKPGDIVIEVSGGSPTQPTGRSLYFTQSMLERFSVPVVPTSFCRRFRPRSIDAGLILTQHLQNLYAEGGTWEYQNQSTGIANFQTSHFLEAEKVIVPSTSVMRAFSDFCMPIMEKMQSNENQFLAQTRDFLLPRLMSGELRVAGLAPSDQETAA